MTLQNWIVINAFEKTETPRRKRYGRKLTVFKTHYRPAEIKKKCIENPMQPAAIINVTTEKGTDTSLPYSV